MVEIQCVACEKTIKPRQLNDTDNYDTENYDGQIVCQECKSLLHVKLVKGKVQKYKMVESKFKDPNSLNWIDLLGSAQEAIKQHGKADREGTKQ
ncbi:hypothetical protein ACFLU9_00560 [Chloroflexota bacterium]